MENDEIETVIKNVGGRPKAKIDYGIVERLASIFCTKDEIATVLDLNPSTLYADKVFQETFKRGREHGKMSLRRKQFKLAEKNSAMAIWLGKQYLGQRDLIEEQSTKPISVISDVRNEEEETEPRSASSTFQSNGDDYNVIDNEEDEGK